MEISENDCARIARECRREMENRMTELQKAMLNEVKKELISPSYHCLRTPRATPLRFPETSVGGDVLSNGVLPVEQQDGEADQRPRPPRSQLRAAVRGRDGAQACVHHL